MGCYKSSPVYNIDNKLNVKKQFLSSIVSMILTPICTKDYDLNQLINNYPEILNIEFNLFIFLKRDYLINKLQINIKDKKKYWIYYERWKSYGNIIDHLKLIVNILKPKMIFLNYYTKNMFEKYKKSLNQLEYKQKQKQKLFLPNVPPPDYEGEKKII